MGIQSTYRLGRKATLWVMLVPVLLTAIMAILLTTDATRGFTMRLSRENSVIEFVSAGLMLGGGVFGLRLSWKAKAQGVAWWVWGFFLLFSLGMLLVGMEEIAWGQKLFGFATPAVMKEINQQGELTLHNLPGLQGHSEVMWAAFGVGGAVGCVCQAVAWV